VIRALDMVVACGGLLFLCYASGCGAAWSAASGLRAGGRSPMFALERSVCYNVVVPVMDRVVLQIGGWA
jgi:hypothetical protein